MNISVDKDSEAPAYRQIYLQIRDKVFSGLLKPGDKLPGIRELASSISVSHNTVSSAYKQLSVEGIATGKRHVGYVIEDIDLSLLNGVRKKPSKRKRLASSTTSHLPMGDSYGCTYDFSYGNRRPSTLPIAIWKESAEKALSQSDLTDAASYIDTYGLLGLREQIVDYIQKHRSVKCTPDHVIMQPGTQAALRNITAIFPKKERIIAMEEPGYDAARHVFERRAEELLLIPTYDGSDKFMKSLEASNAKLAFMTPSNQFPLGYILPLSCRLKAINWARNNDAFIIEDDYCCEYRYGSSPVPSIQALDPDRVIYMGTMSKILSPAMRMSYIVLPDSLVEKWNGTHSYESCELPWLDQEMMRIFMGSAAWNRYHRTTVSIYKRSHDTLVRSIEKYMGDKVTIIGKDAGLHILLGDNHGRNQDELVKLARKNDVRVYETDNYWYKSPHPMRNFVLIGFSLIDENMIDEGIKRLAKAWYG